MICIGIIKPAALRACFGSTVKPMAILPMHHVLLSDACLEKVPMAVSIIVTGPNSHIKDFLGEPDTIGNFNEHWRPSLDEHVLVNTVWYEVYSKIISGDKIEISITINIHKRCDVRAA